MDPIKHEGGRHFFFFFNIYLINKGVAMGVVMGHLTPYKEMSISNVPYKENK